MKLHHVRGYSVFILLTVCIFKAKIIKKEMNCKKAGKCSYLKYLHYTQHLSNTINVISNNDIHSSLLLVMINRIIIKLLLL